MSIRPSSGQLLSTLGFQVAFIGGSVPLVTACVALIRLSIPLVRSLVALVSGAIALGCRLIPLSRGVLATTGRRVALPCRGASWPPPRLPPLSAPARAVMVANFGQPFRPALS